MMYDFIRNQISNLANKSICNEQYWKQLPYDQQKILDEILKDIHDIAISVNNINLKECNVLPQYQAQFRDAMIIKLATEIGIINR